MINLKKLQEVARLDAAVAKARADLSPAEVRVLEKAAKGPVWPHSPKLHEDMAEHHEKTRGDVTNNYTLALQHNNAAFLHRKAAKMLKARDPKAHAMSYKAHDYTDQHRLY
jgi:hypothetical protein